MCAARPNAMETKLLTSVLSVRDNGSPIACVWRGTLRTAVPIPLEWLEKSFLDGEERMKTMFRRVLAPMLLSVLVIPGQLPIQNSTRPKKVLTPEQQELQKRFKSYRAQREALQMEAAKAFDAEAARGKSGDCKNASDTRGVEICLAKEGEITEANYSAFTRAIRELLNLAYPSSNQPATSGPTGTPPDTDDLTREFDNLQIAWQQYRKIGTSTGYDQYKGGTLAPVFSIEVDQELVRSHMRELSFIYDGLLHR